METSCQQCHHKDDLINKYLKLIKLLKAKCDKSVKSFIKNNTMPSDTLHQTSLENSESLSSDIRSPLFKSNLNPEKISTEKAKSVQLKLALMIMSNRAKKSLLKQSFQDLKECINDKKSNNTEQVFERQIKLSSGSIQSLIQETLKNGKSFQNNPQIQSSKQLNSKILRLQIKNDELGQKITKIQRQLSESERRFLKEMEKKADSLQTFGEEIREKSEIIVELQYTIKQYETVLGRKLDKPAGNVLDDDLEELIQNCQRLQSVNQKLNNNVKALEENVLLLNKQVLTLKLRNGQMKEESESLKERLFDLSHQLGQQQQTSTSYKNLLKKFNQKLSAMKLKEKNMLFSLRSCSSNTTSYRPQFLTQSSEPTPITNFKIISTKNTEVSQQENQAPSIREMEAEQKIQEVFAFLFNIREEKYLMENERLFDGDQKQLLKVHKDLFLNHIKDQSFDKINRETLKQDFRIDQSHFMKENDELFYIQSSCAQKNFASNQQEDSILCAFQPQKQHNVQPNISHIKLVELQIDKSKLIQKISDLKNLHMHIRNVVLNLMKSIDLSASKPQTSSILEVVFDFFQYSEDQKAAIFKDKKKKFWGLL